MALVLPWRLQPVFFHVASTLTASGPVCYDLAGFGSDTCGGLAANQVMFRVNPLEALVLVIQSEVGRERPAFTTQATSSAACLKGFWMAQAGHHFYSRRITSHPAESRCGNKVYFLSFH